jgi:hypothetical protein
MPRFDWLDSSDGMTGFGANHLIADVAATMATTRAIASSFIRPSSD